ncbi:MAG TPA: FAD-binding protein [Actinomycetota bacterium]|nr:FAD-binding protein [Actinomycetota bacterium]
MDLIHPHTVAGVIEAVRTANAEGHRLLVVGGRRHIDKGNPSEVDAELWTTQLDRVIAYDPAEMVAVVEAGMRVGELQRALAEGGQEWPVDAPDDATVGGVIAAAPSSPRRLKVGAVRDTVLETEVVTGDGRLVRSGARTVKQVTGYQIHRLVTGSLGTLGVIVQVALKVRPLPEVRRTLRLEGNLELARTILGSVPAAAGVLVTPDGVHVRLEGWRGEVEEQHAATDAVARPVETVDDAPFPLERSWEERPVVVEAAVPPSRLGSLEAGEASGALAGVGILWAGLGGAEQLEALRSAVHAAGGIAPVVRGAGGLGDDPLPAPEVQGRLKHAFDPNGVLAPGRGWGGI